MRHFWSQPNNRYIVRKNHHKYMKKTATVATTKMAHNKTDTSMIWFWTLNIFHAFSSVSIVDFEQVNVSWVIPWKNCREKHFLIFKVWYGITGAYSEPCQTSNKEDFPTKHCILFLWQGSKYASAFLLKKLSDHLPQVYNLTVAGRGNRKK